MTEKDDRNIMESEEKRKNVFSRFLNGKGFYIVLILCIVAIGISGYILLFSDNKPADDTTVSSDHWNDNPVSVVIDNNAAQTSGGDAAQPQDQGGVHMSSPVPEMSVSAQPDEPASAPASVPDTETVLPDDDAVAVSAPADTQTSSDEIFCAWPVVSGDIVQSWSVDALVFNPTLGDWRVHDGIDISCSSGSPVLAVAAGVVTEVYEDPLMGMTVVVDHKNGMISKYSNLTLETSVAVGDAVNTGDQLGAVGGSASSEESLGSHLHFAMSIDGVSVDPVVYITPF